MADIRFWQDMADAVRNNDMYVMIGDTSDNSVKRMKISELLKEIATTGFLAQNYYNHGETYNRDELDERFAELEDANATIDAEKFISDNGLVTADNLQNLTYPIKTVRRADVRSIDATNGNTQTFARNPEDESEVYTFDKETSAIYINGVRYFPDEYLLNRRSGEITFNVLDSNGKILQAKMTDAVYIEAYFGDEMNANPDGNGAGNSGENNNGTCPIPLQVYVSYAYKEDGGYRISTEIYQKEEALPEVLIGKSEEEGMDYLENCKIIIEETTDLGTKQWECGMMEYGDIELEYNPSMN